MTGKKLVTLTLVMVFVLGLMGGVASASEPPNWFIEGEWEGWSWQENNTFTLTVHEQDVYGNFIGTSVYGLGDERTVVGKVSGDKVEFMLDSVTYTSLMVGDITATTMAGTFQDTSGTTNKDEDAVWPWEATGEAINIADGSFPAAPAIANELLKDAGIKARYGERNTGGNYIADVANHMDDNERFNGVSKYNKEAYRAQILAFLIGKGADLLPDGQILWLDAANYSDSIWADKSGESNNAEAQGNPSESNINGLPAVRFDGTNDCFVANNVTANISGEDKPYSAFAIVQRKNSDSQDAIFSFGNSATFWPVINARTTNASVDSTPNQLRVIRRDNSQILKESRGGEIGTNATLISIVDNGILLNAYQDSTQIITDADVDVGAITLNQFSLGVTRIGSSYFHYFHGDIAEILIYSHALSDAELEVVEAYLSAKYGL